MASGYNTPTYGYVNHYDYAYLLVSNPEYYQGYRLYFMMPEQLRAHIYANGIHLNRKDNGLTGISYSEGFKKLSENYPEINFWEFSVTVGIMCDTYRIATDKVSSISEEIRKVLDENPMRLSFEEEEERIEAVHEVVTADVLEGEVFEDVDEFEYVSLGEENWTENVKKNLVRRLLDKAEMDNETAMTILTIINTVEDKA